MLLDPRSFMAAGVTCLVLAAIAGPLQGDAMLTGLWWKQVIPGVGKLSTILLFDIGVYLSVMGTVLLILFTLSEED
jgi:multisubunit Na+/H+ antiporter MnhB subunit